MTFFSLFSHVLIFFLHRNILLGSRLIQRIQSVGKGFQNLQLKTLFKKGEMEYNVYLLKSERTWIMSFDNH